MKGRKNVAIDATIDEINDAKTTAVSLIGEVETPSTIDDLFYCNNLSEIEDRVKNLNTFSNKSWILSAILVYTLIFDKGLYKQSGMQWDEYQKSARDRLGIEKRDISEQLSAARFFIQHHKSLQRLGWSANGMNRKLARAELALSISGNLDETLDHLVNDTWRDFKDWYQGLKDPKSLEQKSELIRQDITIKNGKAYIGKVEAVKISDKIPQEDKERLQEYIQQIFDAWQHGHELAIVPVYDKKEAAIIPRLRDKYRQKK